MQKILPLLLKSTAILLWITNLVIGWGLSQERGRDPELHFYLAIASIPCWILGCWFWLKKLELKSKVCPPEEFVKLKKIKETALPIIGVSIILLVISALTGTISHSGQMPYIHIVIGLGLVGSGIRIMSVHLSS